MRVSRFDLQIPGTPTPLHPYASVPRLRGFSLVELLVVIAIIIILVGIGVAGMNMAFTRSAESQTRIILQGLSAAMQEYQASTGVSLSQDSDVDDLEAFIERITQIDSVNTMLIGLGPEGEIVEISGTTNRVTTINDPWGNEIRYFRTNDPNHPDHDRPFFVSDGPDGDEGDYNNGNPDEEHEDNIYSYDID